MRRLYHYGMMVAAAAVLAASGTAAQAADPDLQGLQQQINQLQQQLKDLQAKQAAQPAAPAAVLTPAPGGAIPATPRAAGKFGAGAGGVAGSFAGAFVIPGTNTSFKVGGQAKLDVTYDADAGIGGAGAQSYGIKGSAIATGQQGFALPGTAAARQAGRFNESARSSRITVETRTPSEFGEVKFYVETDFQGANASGSQTSSNSTELRLRQAYGTLGNWTAGQTWTLMEDRATIPASLDLNTTVGTENGLRIPLVSYLWNIDKAQNHQLSFGVENPVNDWKGADNESFGNSGTFDQTNNVTKAPDLTFKYAYNQPWGRLIFSGVGRYLEANSAGSSITNQAGVSRPIHSDTLGWAFSTGGKVKTNILPVPEFLSRDAVTFRVTGGQGIGRYLQVNSPAAALVDNTGKLKPVQAGGVSIGLQHWYNDRWQSNAIFGKQHIFWQDSLISAANQQGLQKNVEELELNVVWMPNPWLQIGAAYFYADTEVAKGLNLAGVTGATQTVSGTTAHDNRVQFTTIVGF